MKAFRKWLESNQWTQLISDMTAKLWKRSNQYRQAFKHDGCYRTSNLVDRLMNRMTCLMYPGRGIHGNHTTSERRLRGSALMVNLVSYAYRSNETQEHRCPAHQQMLFGKLDRKHANIRLNELENGGLSCARISRSVSNLLNSRSKVLRNYSAIWNN